MSELIELTHELLGHNDGRVKQIASLIQGIDADLKDGLLTVEEYESLLSDVHNYKLVIEKSNDVQLGAMINRAVSLLMEAAKYAKF